MDRSVNGTKFQSLFKSKNKKRQSYVSLGFHNDESNLVRPSKTIDFGFWQPTLGKKNCLFSDWLTESTANH